MELQFHSKSLGCLQSVLWGVKSQEQTQEVRLPEAMPDVGRILGAWGQCVLRGKEWHGGIMSATGGVMAWVLYEPEDGTFPRVVEAWLPYQIHWELPQTQRDGTMIVRPSLKSADARVLSARKLMVRVCVEAVGEAYEPIRMETYFPEGLPEKLCVLQKKYPVSIPVEAGEKTLSVEEELQLPPECADTGKLIYYCLRPEIQEQKQVGNKLLFRGNCVVHGLCRCADNRLCGFRFDVPFSQYAELEQSDGDSFEYRVVPAVTNLELDLLEGGKLLLKASLVGQYLVCQRKVLEVVEDAYCLDHHTELQIQPLLLPTVLDQKQDVISSELRMDLPAQDILDVAFMLSQPAVQWDGVQGVCVARSGTYQVLWEDAEQKLQMSCGQWEQPQGIPAGENVKLCCTDMPAGIASGHLTGNGIQLRCDVTAEAVATAWETIPMVTGLEIMETVEDPGEKPSMILRRPGSASLWDIAKQYGSTEAAIRQANGLESDPLPDRMLLIPVL